MEKNKKLNVFKCIIFVLLFLLSVSPISVTAKAKVKPKPKSIKYKSITLSKSTASSLKIKWKGVKNAKKYQIRYKINKPGYKWVTVIVKHKKKNKITLKKLKQNSKYVIQIRSVNGKKKSKWTKRKYYKTKKRKTKRIYDTCTYRLANVNYWNYPAMKFFGDRAWARFYDTNGSGEYIGLINKKGTVVSRYNGSSINGTNASLNSVLFTPIIKGLSALYLTDDNWSGKLGISFYGFLIINSNGKIVYKCSDKNTYMGGQADDGVFLIGRHESGFAGDHWYLSILDTSLKLTTTKIEVSESYIKGIQRNRIYAIVPGVIYTCGDYIINLKTQSIYKVSNSYYGQIENTAFFGLYFVPIEKLLDVSTDDEFRELLKKESKKLDTKNSGHTGYSVCTWNKGCFYHYDTVSLYDPIDYVDINGNTIMTFPKLPGDASYLTADLISGGYVAVYLKGADGNHYVSIIDEHGKMKYSPVKLNASLNYRGSVYRPNNAVSINGYIVVVSTGLGPRYTDIIDPNGNRKNFGDDLSGMSSDMSRYDDIHISIGKDYLWTHNPLIDDSTKYVSLDGKNTIRYVTAYYDKNYNLIY